MILTELGVIKYWSPLILTRVPSPCSVNKTVGQTTNLTDLYCNINLPLIMCVNKKIKRERVQCGITPGKFKIFLVQYTTPHSSAKILARLKINIFEFSELILMLQHGATKSAIRKVLPRTGVHSNERSLSYTSRHFSS